VRKLLVPVLTLALLGVAAVPAMAVTRVKIGDNYFVREVGVPKVTVQKNSRVKWVWRGENSHNVKVLNGPATFGSSTMRTGSYVKKVTRKGTYTLFCAVHGARDQSMKLVVE
jgi:plastocyanin